MQCRDRHLEKEQGGIRKRAAEQARVEPGLDLGLESSGGERDPPAPRGRSHSFLERNKESEREMHGTQTTVTNHC